MGIESIDHPLDTVGSRNPIMAYEQPRRSNLGQCRAVIRSLLYLLPRRVLGVLRSHERVAAEVEVENAVLRHQVAILFVASAVFAAGERRLQVVGG